MTAPGVSAEFAFVCTSASPHDLIGAGGDGGEGEDLDTGVNWDRLAAIAHRHQVVPLVIEALGRRGHPIPPALAARHDPLAPLRSAREAIRLRTLFIANGIAPIFLKGSALAVLAYGAIARRQFGDIDLLVHPDDACRAAMLLEDAGYSLPGRSPDVVRGCLADRVARTASLAKDMAVRHRGNGQIVELHWRMTDNPCERPVREREGVQWVELAPGAAIPTLATDALFAYICNHGATHMWARLRWLADVAALIAREPDGGNRLWQGAVARGQGRAAASAILLARQYLAAPPPPAFAPHPSLRLNLLITLSTHILEAGGGTTELARTRWRGWAEMTGKLLVISRAGDLAGWVLRLLFSASDQDDTSRSRFWVVLHPLQRIPKLLRRRRRRNRCAR